MNPFLLDFFFLVFFIVLNILHMKTGSMLQMVFTMLKIFPIFFIIVVGVFLFNGSAITDSNILWTSIPSTLPLVLYGILGFEAACSLSSQIREPEKKCITCSVNFLWYRDLYLFFYINLFFMVRLVNHLRNLLIIGQCSLFLYISY